jgi:hypothetical protein
MVNLRICSSLQVPPSSPSPADRWAGVAAIGHSDKTLCKTKLSYHFILFKFLFLYFNLRSFTSVTWISPVTSILLQTKEFQERNLKKKRCFWFFCEVVFWFFFSSKIHSSWQKHHRRSYSLVSLGTQNVKKGSNEVNCITYSSSRTSYMHIKSLISFAYCSFWLIVIHLMKKSLSGKSTFLCVSLHILSSYLKFFWNFGTIHSLHNNNNNETSFHFY